MPSHEHNRFPVLTARVLYDKFRGVSESMGQTVPPMESLDPVTLEVWFTFAAQVRDHVRGEPS